MSDSNLRSIIIKEYSKLLLELYKEGLAIDSNEMSNSETGYKKYSITFANKNDSSKILFDKNVSANDILDQLVSNRQYSILLNDRSIIQIEYIIESDEVMKGRLLFIKKHNRILSKTELELIRELDDWGVIDNSIPTLLRFDYDIDSHKEYKHPASHLTISNNISCRIPVKNVLSVTEFMNFILHHFYDYELQMKTVSYDDSSKLSRGEQHMIHLTW